VPEPVWGHSLADQGGDLLARCGGILFQLEADPGGFEGISIPVHEDGFTFPPRLAFQGEPSAVQQSPAKEGRFALFCLYQTGEPERAIPNEGPEQRDPTPLEYVHRVI
jgi:hypothetical protein